MKASARLKKYFKKWIASIEGILQKNEAEYSAKEYHQLRVNIKKVRAILVLVNAAGKKINLKKYFKPFKKVFKRAGKVRDLQLQEIALGKLESANVLENFISELKTKREKKEKKFFNYNTSKTIHEISDLSHSSVAYIKRVKKKRIKKFLSKKKTSIHRFKNTKGLRKKNLHKLRKHLKSFYYILKIFPFTKKHTKKEIKKYLNLLGDWHDQVVMKKYITSVLHSNRLPKEEKQPLKKLKKKFAHKSQVLYSEIISSSFL